jgi:molybdopterin converting factor small subunit
MMKVEVHLFANLKRFLPEGEGPSSLIIEIADSATVSSVLNLLKIPEEMINLVLVNGKHIDDRGHRLSDGAIISIFPPVAGG